MFRASTGWPANGTMRMVLLSSIATALIATIAVRAHFAVNRMQRCAAIITTRLRDVEQRVRPHSDDDAVLEHAMRLIERAPRCPTCRGIVRATGRFCPTCGENFANATTVGGRLTRYAIDQSTGEIDLRWQCFSCGGETRTLPDTLRTDAVQIIPLCCDHCEIAAGEILIDPRNTEIPEPRPTGSLRLSQCVNAIKTSIDSISRSRLDSAPSSQRLYHD